MSEGTPIKTLPRLVDPRKFAQQQVSLAGIVPEENLPRLMDVCFSDDAASRPCMEINADLTFSCDDEGRRCLNGSLTAQVVLECQRCLEALELTIATEVNLVVVWDESQAQALPRNLDPWIVAEEQGDLHAVLEEELLLALPAVAFHEYECVDASAFSVGEEAEFDRAEADGQQNPFSVLSRLKSGPKQSD